MITWTTDQQSAIDARGSNLLVAAAAGSGKTAVLVERIIQIILKDKIDIDKLLIVTFTNAAAGEMREKIVKAIMKEIDGKDNNEGHLRKQISLLNRASITTIHSFCIDVLRRHFHVIDMDPSFRIGDITETSILKLEALEELFEEKYEIADNIFFQLIETFGGTKEDRPLQDLVLKIYSFIQSQPYPEKWLRDKVEDFQLILEDFDHNIWVKTIKGRIKIRLEAALGLLNDALAIAKEPEGPEGYQKAINSDIKKITDLYNNIDLPNEEFHTELHSIKHDTIKTGKGCLEELREQSKSLRDQAKKIIKDIKDNVLISSPKQYIEDLNKLYPLMDYLFKLVVRFAHIYGEKKAEKGIIDFNDLEHFALKILANDLVAKEYKERFEHIFVDEYQDSNIVQETLIQSIKRDDNLFMVGDVKQSIYRFRLADPTLFIEKYETFGIEEGDLNRRIDLSKNFRSRGEILSGVNYIFKYIMSKDLGEIDYDDKAALYIGDRTSFKPIKDPAIEINLIEKEFDYSEDDETTESEDIEGIDETKEVAGMRDLEELAHIEVEAHIVAQRIKRLLNEEIYDKSAKKPEKSTKEEGKKEEVGYRKIEYKDIVVLLRATKNWAQPFLETFIMEGIPVYADANTGYFEAIEVSMFLNLLRVIDNKRQDIPLLSVMRSPIGNFTTKELIDIRIYDKSGTYYEAIEKYIEENDGQLKYKLISFIEKLNSWSSEATYIKIDQFIWKLFIDTGYYYYVGAMPGGIQRQANLRILFDRASQFEKTSIKGLFNFIKFIEKLQSSQGDMGAAKILGENDNVVRIMSIHKSKGLEFPVVIVAGTGKQFNLKDINESVLLHKDLGLGPKFVDTNLRTYRDTIAKIAMKDQIKIESLSEEMRILYVALTRAEDKLIIVGSLKNIEKFVAKWENADSIYSLMNAKTYLDWIGPALIKHPDGEELRQLAELELDETNYKKEDSRWVINILGRTSIQKDEGQKAIREQEYREKLIDFNRANFPAGDYTSYKDEIYSRLNWEYSHVDATIIPSKLSVSDIKKATIKEIDFTFHQIPTLIKSPRFMEGKKDFTAMERGTIVHFVLQHLNLDKVYSQDDIKEQIDLMVVRELISKEESRVVNIEKILNYFNSEIGKRMLASNKVYRESSFIIEKLAKDVIDGLPEGLEEKLLVQGIIDCYFEEEDGLVLIDYKNDIVFNGDISNIVDRYKVQLSLYKEALEQITRKKVTETYLYLLDIDKGVKI